MKYVTNIEEQDTAVLDSIRKRAEEIFDGQIPYDFMEAFLDADPMVRDLIMNWWPLIARNADGPRFNFVLGLSTLEEDHPSRLAFETAYLQIQEFWAVTAAMSKLTNQLANAICEETRP